MSSEKLQIPARKCGTYSAFGTYNRVRQHVIAKHIDQRRPGDQIRKTMLISAAGALEAAVVQVSPVNRPGEIGGASGNRSDSMHQCCSNTDFNGLKFAGRYANVRWTRFVVPKTATSKNTKVRIKSPVLRAECRKRDESPRTSAVKTPVRRE